MQTIWVRLERTPFSLWLVYLVVYISLGALAQFSAPYLEIAHFAHDWQFITLYGGFLVPLSILIRGLPWYQQYAYALMVLAPLEIVAFTLQTSVAYPDNVLDALVGERNFTLTMVVVAAWIPYLGNRVIKAITQRLGWLPTTDLPAQAGE